MKCDLFHGIQRLTKTIPKRHVFCSEACKELGMVFRQPGDFGIKRELSTPKENDILHNMELFLLKWKDVEYKGWKLLNDNFTKSWNNLKVHVEKGCFSQIPAG